ncbi:MAG TPA: cyclase family protein [Candidatus Saccharimonadales bacterium]|jgi:kynurenine formamidase
MTYIDLTHTLSTDTPIFPGDPKLHIEPAATFDLQGNSGHSLSLGTHTGTHIDAPAHMIPGGKTLDDFDVASFIGRGVYIAVSGATISLDLVQAADIHHGDIVMIDTGMVSKYGQTAYYESYPVLTTEAAAYLAQKGIKMAGIDACSFDNDPSFPIHKILLGANILLVENVANLHVLADTSFTVSALPIRLNLDGAPARVIAEVQ